MVTEHRRRRVRGGLVALVALVVLAGCQPSRLPLFTANSSSTYGAGYVTQDRVDRFAISTTGTGIHAQALATNVDGNTRMLIWPKGVDAVVDGESCAVWTGRSAGAQQGAALRVTRAGSRIRAVTVTQNVYYGAGWIFNVHTWDTAYPDRDGNPFRFRGRIEFDWGFASRPFPWHVCARVIGDEVELKSWTTREREPAWGDRDHSGRVTLPPGWRQRGQVGWYVGHLEPREHADYAELSTWTYDPRAQDRSHAEPTTEPSDIGRMQVTGT